MLLSNDTYFVFLFSRLRRDVPHNELDVLWTEVDEYVLLIDALYDFSEVKCVRRILAFLRLFDHPLGSIHPDL